MCKVLHDLATARLSNIFTDSCSAKNYHLRNAENWLAVPLAKPKFLRRVSAIIVLRSGIAYQMKYVIVKLWLRLISLCINLFL